MNRHIKKISSYTMIGGVSALVLAGISGCGDSGVDHAQQQAVQQQQVVKEGATVTIEKQADGSYKIIDEAPSTKTRVIVVEDGKERILTQEEIDKLVKEEAARVEAGTSKLTQPPEEVAKDGGMGLAGTLMASMAGAMVGSYLMNKLMNNQNYQQNRRTTYKSPQVYSRSQSSFSKARAAAKSAKSSAPRKTGFFSSKSKSSSSSRSIFGG